MLNPKTAAEYAYFLYDIDGAEGYNQGKITDFSKVGAKAVDDLTLQVTLVRPASYWLSLTAFVVMFPQRVDVINRAGERWTEPEHFVGVGPYVIKVWEHDKRMVLERNEKYWGPKPQIARAVALIVEEATTGFPHMILSDSNLPRCTGNGLICAATITRSIVRKSPLPNPKFGRHLATRLIVTSSREY
jgi:ABC-type oligopeptide transport system substrate-binding subunit